MNQETDIALTLEERGKNYGSFQIQATTSQRIKNAMRQGSGCKNWAKLDDDQRECLEMLAVKISRILNGNPNHYDSWYDIMGYVKLVVDRLSAEERLRLNSSRPIGSIGVTGSVGPKEASLGLPFEKTASSYIQVVGGEVKWDQISD